LCVFNWDWKFLWQESFLEFWQEASGGFDSAQPPVWDDGLKRCLDWFLEKKFLALHNFNSFSP